jgi:hypothetical protein
MNKYFIIIIFLIFGYVSTAKSIVILIGASGGQTNLTSKTSGLGLKGYAMFPITAFQGFGIGGQKYLSKKNNLYQSHEFLDLIYQYNYIRLGAFYGYYSDNISEFFKTFNLSTTNSQYGPLLSLQFRFAQNWMIVLDGRYHYWGKDSIKSPYLSSMLGLEFYF